jgi:hypothetical protein
MEHSEVDWSAVREYDEALKATPQIVREAEGHMRERWNHLLFQLCDLLDKPYDGETSDELVELLREKMNGNN